jgi:predicted O-methyltransferase YrrM
MAPAPTGEPNSSGAIAAWIRAQTRARDRFADVYDASERHREEHGPECTVYPTGSGPLLGTLAAATGAKRILEVGCGLGYGALWLAYGSAPDGRVESIEPDAGHAELAQRHLDQEAYADRIALHPGRGAEVLPKLTGPYGLIFCDSDLDEYGAYLDHFARLLRPGGLLITSNLFLGQYGPDIPGLDQAAAYRLQILDDKRLLTAFLKGGMALSVRRQD